MEALIDTLVKAFTPEWAMAALFNLALLIILYVRSRLARRPVDDYNPGQLAPRITIINNVRGCRRIRTRSIRARRRRQARRKLERGRDDDCGQED